MREKTWSELHDLLGDDGAARMVERFGGRDITIPRRNLRDHPLAAALTPGQLVRLTFAWAGCRVYIPSRSALGRAQRNRRIRRLRESGDTVRAIADREGLSERQVRNILSGGGGR